MLRQFINIQAGEWNKFVVQQLAQGGGKLFAYISREDKAFLNIDISRAGSGCSQPSEFLAQQSHEWAKYWAAPLSKQKANDFKEYLKTFHKHALNNVRIDQYNNSTFKQAIHKYKKDSQGCDLWASTELKGLPDICVSGLSDVYKKATEAAVLPNQTLLSLNVLLGKPNGGNRTICKTPMLYRIWNNQTNIVREWEDIIIEEYDTCWKHILH